MDLRLPGERIPRTQWIHGVGGGPPLSRKTVGEAWELRAVEPSAWSRRAVIFQAPTTSLPFPQFLGSYAVSQTEKVVLEMQNRRQRNGVWEGHRDGEEEEEPKSP